MVPSLPMIRSSTGLIANGLLLLMCADNLNLFSTIVYQTLNKAGSSNIKIGGCTYEKFLGKR